MNLSVFTKLALVLLGAFFIWQLFVYLRSHPEALSKNNLNRSVTTLGFLALLLIGFVAVLVWWVK